MFDCETIFGENVGEEKNNFYEYDIKSNIASTHKC